MNWCPYGLLEHKNICYFCPFVSGELAVAKSSVCLGKVCKPWPSGTVVRPRVRTSSHPTLCTGPPTLSIHT